MFIPFAKLEFLRNKNNRIAEAKWTFKMSLDD
jgi:hypothetical protein